MEQIKANEISQLILDTMEDIVYLSDTKTYELYYLNGVAIKGLGLEKNGEWYRKKCYKILQGLDAPCSFCTNHHLRHDEFYNWEHYNPVLKKHYYIQDKLVCFDGQYMRMEIAKNITEVKLLEQQVAQKYQEQRVVNQCMEMLHSTYTPEESINRLLEIIANYYNAERGYIFALSEDRKLVSNTYEWCQEGIEPQIDNLQQLPSTLVAHWFEKYETVGEFYINALDKDVVLGSDEYDILDAQGITSLVTAPLRDKAGVIVGFIGVDNPRRNIRETTVIRAVTVFIADFFDKNELIEKLNRLSYYDSLTSLKNRHSYSIALERMCHEEKTSLGVVYVDVNGLKIINDKLGHKVGDQCILSVAHTVRALFTGFTYRIGGDEFVALCKGVDEDSFKDKIKQLEDQLKIGEESKASVGYVWKEDSREVIDQIERADSLMYDAKQRYYSGKMRQENPAKVSIETIKKALRDVGCL